MRDEINRYVKDSGVNVSENLVPMNLLRSVVSYGREWNSNFV